ncbi:MAG: hypothetical protein ACRD51_15955 [Candidatus Acidiferrum sp.]
MNEKTRSQITRREFARRAAIVSAVSLIPPRTSAVYPASEQPSTQQPPNAPSLSAASQAEAETRYQAILALYASRFSDAQKSELRGLCFSAQPALDHLRAFEIENGDAPALYLKPLMEKENPHDIAAFIRDASRASKKP